MNAGSTEFAERRAAAYWALAALFAMNLLNYIDRNILSALVEPVQRDLGMQGRDALIGFLSTAFFLSYALFSPLIGWLGDRVTRRYLLAAGVGIWSLATFGSGLARSYGEMLLARSVMGIGEATYAVIAPTLIADLFPRRLRSRVLAVFYLAMPLGVALGYAIGGQVNMWLGWRWAFYVVGIPGLAVALGALFIREPRRGASEEVVESLPLSWASYVALARNRSFVLNCLAMAMMTFALGGLAWWAPKYLGGKWAAGSASPAEALRDASVLLGAAIVFGGLVGTALGGWLGDRFAQRIRGAHFLLSGIGMLLAVPFVGLALIASGKVAVFLSMAAGLTLIFLSTGPSNAIIVNVTQPGIRASAFAVNILVIHLLGDIPSPPAMGAVSDFTGSMFWGMVVTLPVLALSGVLYCMGVRHLDADQEAMLQQLRTAA